MVPSDLNPPSTGKVIVNYQNIFDMNKVRVYLAWASAHKAIFPPYFFNVL